MAQKLAQLEFFWWEGKKGDNPMQESKWNDWIKKTPQYEGSYLLPEFFWKINDQYVPYELIGPHPATPPAMALQKLKEMGFTREEIAKAVLRERMVEHKGIYSELHDTKADYEHRKQPWLGVLVHQGVIVAYAKGQTMGRTPFVDLSRVDVHPLYRGKGLCTLLMNQVFAKFKARADSGDSVFRRIKLVNFGGRPGEKCYLPAAKKAAYHVTCIDDPEEEAQHPDYCSHFLFHL